MKNVHHPWRALRTIFLLHLTGLFTLRRVGGPGCAGTLEKA
jgi:hypothetical protein